MKFEIFKDVSGQFRWRLKSLGNGQVVATSGEGYLNKADVVSIIQKIKANIGIAAISDLTLPLGSLIRLARG